ncbi:hypothetical protein [Pontibacter ruber]|uniref:DUF998 domain-containing protein n=1 Tax=Pontibacter ruber TaxID=1343895 RepID=A0ABW5CXK1_9BACT|nr:hypothetical protein [Pontibacter ruber]
MIENIQSAINDKPDRQKEADNDLVYSYMTLRNLIGLSGMLLPLALVLTTSRGLDDKLIEPSISDYYYTSNGDVLVVLLSILGVFLFTYKGYNWVEQVLTALAAICGIGVAFSPTATKHARSSFSIHTTHDAVPTILGLERHLIFAAVFFISLAFISLVYFPKSDALFLKEPTGKWSPKAKRNMVYKVCGWMMIVCVLLLGIYFIYEPFQIMAGEFPVIFTLETIAVEAFGISWLTKGETLWPDGEHYLVRGYRKAKHTLKEKLQHKSTNAF